MKRIIQIFLLTVGFAQMLGDVSGISGLKGVAAATAASPAPKVFSVAGGLETYSTAFYIEWRDVSGKVHSLKLTPEINARLKGPYNRRNIYGAAISYGPVLAINPRTKKMLADVMYYALCNDAPLLQELGIDPRQISGIVHIRFEPKWQSSGLPLVMEAPCRR